MSYKCDNCNKAATVHLTEIKNGKQIEKHLCEQCAAQNEGLQIKGHAPINELLTNFVMQHSGLQKEQSTACEHCGITWGEFRQQGLLGCQHDYDLFEKDLTPLLQKAHGLDKPQDAHHTGKVPTRRGGTGVPRKKKTIDVAKLKKELQRAVECEDYERAAQLRDAIKESESE